MENNKSNLETPKKLKNTKKQEDNKVFFKEQFANSKEYLHQKDLINALLENDVTYSKKEVQEIIKNYLEGEV